MAVAVAVWSVVVKPGEPLEIEPPADLRITNVALSDELEDQQARSSLRLIYSSPEAASDDEGEDEEEDEEEDEDAPKKVIDTILCSLTPGRIEQATLDLVLEGGVPFALEVTGKNAFHLTGNYIDQAGFDQDPSDFDDDDDEEGYNLGDISSDVEVDPAELGVPGDDDDDEARFEEVDEDASSKKRPRDSDAMEDVIEAGEEKLSKAQKKKLNKKLKAADGSAVATGETAAEAPSAATSASASAAPSKKDKKKGKEAVKEAAKEGAKEGAKEAAKEVAKPKSAEQELPGGLKLRDHKVGTGKTAKKGNTVGMRYIGKLQNGKVFDSNTKGKPFTFNLGKGEVIKGWDEGIVGMAVGGERVLTIPPALAYGKRGAGKDIPPNSTLTFEVKLLEIK